VSTVWVAIPRACRVVLRGVGRGVRPRDEEGERYACIALGGERGSESLRRGDWRLRRGCGVMGAEGGVGGVDWALGEPTDGAEGRLSGMLVLLFRRSLMLGDSSPGLCFASRSVTLTPANSFCRFTSRSSYDSVSVLDMVLRVSAESSVGFQSMGHRTPCFPTAWKASRRRRASRTLRPTVRLLSVILGM
jgi:hypothetical protein